MAIRRKTGARAGGVLVLLALSTVLLVAVAALAIDFAWVYIQEAKLQKGADAAATAAANRALAGGTIDDVRQSARNFGAANGLTFDDSDITLDPSGNGARVVRICRRQSVPLFFGPVLGVASVTVAHDVYGVACEDATMLYGAPIDRWAASGIVPLYVPHADLYGVLSGDIVTKDSLAAKIFAPGQYFRVGSTYVLKTGPIFKNNLQAIVHMGAAQQGGLQLPGQGSGASRWQTYFQNGYGGSVSVGDLLDTEPGTMSNSVSAGVSYRVSQDPNGVFSGWTRTAQPLSARMVICPIVVSYVSGPDDAGTGVAGLRNIPYIWNGGVSVSVIGLAQFYLNPYSTAFGSGVVTGNFVRYIGTPPSGQSPG